MSLIQEALKRQQEDSGNGPAPGTPPPVSPPSHKPEPTPAKAPDAQAPPPQAPPLAMRKDKQPPPIPGAATPTEPQALTPEVEEANAEQQKAVSRTWPTLLGLVALLILLIGGAVWMLLFALQRWNATPDDEPAISELASESIPDVTPEITHVEEASTETADDVADEGDGAETAVPTDEEVADATPDAHPDTPVTRVTEPPAPPAAPVNWPSLTLSGIVGRGTSGSAMINGTIVGAGETIEGVTLLAIETTGARLEYKGEQQLMKVGTVLH